MIEITNPIPVFDDNHNVIKFKYNDGLVVHDCITNTLNVSYIIVRDLIVNGKTIDDVLSELKEHFSLFSDVICHDRDLMINLFKDLMPIEDLEDYPNSILFTTNFSDYMVRYDKDTGFMWLSYEKMFSVFIINFSYNYYQISRLVMCTLLDLNKLNIE